MLKYIDDIPDDEIANLEVPTGIPLLYRLDKDLKVRQAWARHRRAPPLPPVRAPRLRVPPPA